MSGQVKIGCSKNCEPDDGEGRSESLLCYSILDPTGNITALVEDPVPISRQPAVAAGIMERHQEVEQVGFVHFANIENENDRDDSREKETKETKAVSCQPNAELNNIQAHLRMAGGEFCGNASMCAAALYVIRKQKETENPNLSPSYGLSSPGPSSSLVTLKVSGAAYPVEVTLQRTDSYSFQSAIDMPRALGLEQKKMQYGSLSAQVPMVRMEGISHMIIEADSPFYHLLREKAAAETAIRSWCRQVEADGLGLMFLGEPEGETHVAKSKQERSLIPLVYIPGADTVFWENSCASGSAAAGMYLSDKSTGKVFLTLREPGGILAIESDYGSGRTLLRGQVRLIDQVGCNSRKENKDSGKNS